MRTDNMARLKWPAGYDIACSPDGRLLCALGRNVVLIDLRERTRIWTGHPLSHLSSVAFSPNCEMLAVKSTSGNIVVLDTATGAVLSDHCNKADGEGCGVAFTADGEHLIDGSWEGILTVRHALTGEVVIRNEHADEMITRITHDAKRKTWLVLHEPKVASNGQKPSCGYLSIAKWPIKPLQQHKILDLGRYIQAATIAPDGLRFCFRDRINNELMVARIADGEILARTPLIIGGTGSELAWSADGRLIGAVSSDGFRFYGKQSDECWMRNSSIPIQRCFSP
jgi:WD40 repeat protein